MPAKQKESALPVADEWLANNGVGRFIKEVGDMRFFLLTAFVYVFILFPNQAFCSSDKMFEADLLGGKISVVSEAKNDAGEDMLCAIATTYNPLLERGKVLQEKLLYRAKFSILDYLISKDNTVKGVIIKSKNNSYPKPRNTKWGSSFCARKSDIIELHELKNTEHIDNVYSLDFKREKYLEEAAVLEKFLEGKPREILYLKELLDIYREIGDYGKVNQIMDTLVILKREEEGKDDVPTPEK